MKFPKDTVIFPYGALQKCMIWAYDSMKIPYWA